MINYRLRYPPYMSVFGMWTYFAQMVLRNFNNE